MKKIFILTLIIISLNTSASTISQQEYSQVFKHYNACFILYSLNEQKILTGYNPQNRCNQRIAADSTFKIPLSLMAFNEGIINQNTVFKWDGQKRMLPEWNQDQSPRTWLKYSVVWVSQQLTPQLGYARIQHYLTVFNYGNQDFSGDPGKNNGLTQAWLSSSLKISAIEQLNFLKAMLSNQLPINPETVDNTKQNMYQGKLNNGFNYYGKTGAGVQKQGTKLRDGWFVGFIENGNQQYIFVSNLTDKTAPLPTDKSYGAGILKPITIELLNRYFAGKS